MPETELSRAQVSRYATPRDDAAEGEPLPPPAARTAQRYLGPVGQAERQPTKIVQLVARRSGTGAEILGARTG